MDTWPGMQFEPVTLHKYLYANANPVMMIDPSGRFSMADIMAANTIRNIISELQNALLQGWAIFQESNGDGYRVLKKVGIAVATSIGVGVALKISGRIIGKIAKLKSFRKQRSRRGQRLGGDCVKCAPEAAKEFGLDPNNLAPDGKPGLIAPIPGTKPGGPHMAVRLPNGDIYDDTILWNIHQKNKGHIPSGLNDLANYDTFSPDVYEKLLDILDEVSNAVRTDPPVRATR